MAKLPQLSRITNANGGYAVAPIAQSTKPLCKSGNLSNPFKTVVPPYKEGYAKFTKMLSQTSATPNLFIDMDVYKKSRTAHFKTDLFDSKTVRSGELQTCLPAGRQRS
jgi:hypothetical protein